MLNYLSLLLTLNAAPSPNGVYQAALDSLKELNFDQLSVPSYGYSSFLHGCNNGVCSVLNLDGSKTGIDNLPIAANVDRISWHFNLFSVSANDKSTYFYNGSKINIPVPYRTAKVILDGTKICRDTTIYTKKPQPKIAGKNSGKQKKALNIFGFEPVDVALKMKCFDLKNLEESIIPFFFSSSSFGAGLNNGGWGKNDHGYIYHNGKVITESVRTCSEKSDLDGNTFLRCLPLDFSESPSKIIAFDSILTPLGSSFGAYFGHYKNLFFYAKADSFGTDSIVSTINGHRISSHPSTNIIPFLDGTGYCVSDRISATENCLDITSGSKFTYKTDDASLIAFVGPGKFDTIALNSNNEVMRCSKFLTQQMRILSGDWYYYGDQFLVVNQNNRVSPTNIALYSVRYTGKDSLVTKQITPNQSKRIIKFGDNFVYGLN